MQNINTKPQTSRRGLLQTEARRPVGWASRCATLCVTLTLAACASLGGGTPEAQVSRRATERWQALVKGEYSRAYTYNTPGFRAVVTPDAYRNRFGSAVKWQGAEVIRVTCPADNKCIADLRIDFKPALSRSKVGNLETGINETWLLEDGQWWFFQKI